MYAQVALPLPLKQLFSYSIPEDCTLETGMRVKVPFGRRTQIGVCIETVAQIENTKFRIKSIHEVIDTKPVIDCAMLELAKWMSQYYRCSLGEALETMVPSFLQQKSYSKTIAYLQIAAHEEIEQQIEQLQTKFPLQARVLKLVREFDGELTAKSICNRLGISRSAIKTLLKKELLCERFEEQNINPFDEIEVEKVEKPQLSREQQSIVNNLLPVMREQRFFPALVHGVTGSGKTEIYMRCIEEVVDNKRAAIVLVPEIALTPQTVTRFKQRFANVAVLHSELTNAQRNFQWQNILQNKADVIIGPRSALFAPVSNLGLIVVDEEHEPSFKQQNTPRYNARDSAVKRAQISDIPIILGSATPALESYYNTDTDKYNLFALHQRVGDKKLPHVSVIDMKEECRDHKKFVYFSRILLNDLRAALDKGQQAILFLNRRGFATSLTCPQCGYNAKCDNCNIALTYHKKHHTAICHYCNYDYIPPKSCPVCSCPAILYAGAGTQKIEMMLKKIFPENNIVRMDSDTMVGKGKYEDVLSRFGKGEIDILLGTQMIAKGLDFPNVTLVGIISADTALQVPDFRAAERTFQLIVQVAGRSGRGEVAGKVIVQTYHPDHYAIQTAIHQDYHSFLKYEMGQRKDIGYPPFAKLLRVLIQGEKEQLVIDESLRISRCLRQDKYAKNIQILGPAPAPIDRIKNRYRHHLIIKCQSVQLSMHFSVFLDRIMEDSHKSLRVSLDVDPISLV
ncbi:replication restart helicase PriA [Candidatus Uabimicrobium amorphum]|uniref:Replication restart protein PriA n=1 Tax=Uabimicrobium amorphum TaxID=2596890 RepID=A0A5S9IT29_UABAM|nr:primosomal protein N' [Candidatus Uabimicrobium amorphum]BBM87643.1 primosomal protein N' [Candidatus Uabimicrobium amorphum]